MPDEDTIFESFGTEQDDLADAQNMAPNPYLDGGDAPDTEHQG